MHWHDKPIADKSAIIWQAKPAEFGVPKVNSSGLKFRFADASQAARQSRIYRYCLIMSTRNLCPLIALAGSGPYYLPADLKQAYKITADIAQS